MLDHLEACAIWIRDRLARLFLGTGPLSREIVEVTFGGAPRITGLKILFWKRVGRCAVPRSITLSWGEA